jgi:hypothetical protein
MQRLVVLASFVLAALVSMGCEGLIGRGPDPTPQVCEQVFSARRCLAIEDAATAFSDDTRDDVASTLIVPSPRPSDDHILQTLGGAAPITVRVLMRDGTTFDTQMCGGIASGPACADEPQAWDTTGSLIGGGYHDVPCAGEPPDGCATPVPSIDPAVAPDATPIEIPSHSVAIDHVGTYEVSLGTGTLANGILTDATYRLADPWAVDVTFGAAWPHVEIRSLEPDGKPFHNVYEHGRRDGLERVEAVLVFDVKRFDPGATVEVRDVVVR